MLVLTRREGEVLLIGDNVRVTVVRIKDTQVQLGIEATLDVVILREEIAERK
jgi:carbon storage regulator